MKAKEIAIQIGKWANRHDLLANLHPQDLLDLAESHLDILAKYEALENAARKARYASYKTHHDCLELNQVLDQLTPDGAGKPAADEEQCLECQKKFPRSSNALFNGTWCSECWGKDGARNE